MAPHRGLMAAWGPSAGQASGLALHIRACQHCLNSHLSCRSPEEPRTSLKLVGRSCSFLLQKKRSKHCVYAFSRAVGSQHSVQCSCMLTLPAEVLHKPCMRCADSAAFARNVLASMHLLQVCPSRGYRACWLRFSVAQSVACALKPILKILE